MDSVSTEPKAPSSTMSQTNTRSGASILTDAIGKARELINNNLPEGENVVCSSFKQDINNALSNLSIEDILEKMQGPVGDAAMQEAMSGLSQESLAGASNIANSPSGVEMIEKLLASNVDISEMKKRVHRNLMASKGIAQSTSKTSVAAIVINCTRVAREKSFERDKIDSAVKNFVRITPLPPVGLPDLRTTSQTENSKDSVTRTSSPTEPSSSITEISCNRICKGALVGADISVYYNSSCNEKKNKRASKIVGFPVNGTVVLICNNSVSLTCKTLKDAESYI